MTETAIHDDARDAIALIRAVLDDDAEAAKVIASNCDLGGVLWLITGMLAGNLVDDYGKDGAHEVLNRAQRRNAEDAGEA